MIRRITFFTTLVSVLLLATLARPALAAHAAEQLVQDTTESVLARLKTDSKSLKADANLIYPLVEDIVLPHFDFRRMSIWVLGKNWRKADKAQQQQFTLEFRTLLVRTYAKALLEYTDQNIRYLPFHAKEGAKKVTVKTEIVQPRGPGIPLHYSMYLNKAAEWKVYDIKVDGISLVSNYRSSFATEIRNGGIPKLLDKLAQMNQSSSSAEGSSGE
ncbi:MAG: ABC transporter substrate-binding protein [Pseudomonadota bacterium]